MITSSGIIVGPRTSTAPTPADIAIGMCRINRYGGAIWCPLATHSVLVGEYVFQHFKPSEFPFDAGAGWAFGLLHDAAEICTGDIVYPFKPSEMKSVEMSITGLILESLGLGLDDYIRMAAFIKVCDEKVLHAEAVGLNLKGWTERRKQEGRPPARMTDADWEISEGVLATWINPAMVLEGSTHISTMTAVIEMIKNQKFELARGLLSIDVLQKVKLIESVGGRRYRG